MKRYIFFIFALFSIFIGALVKVIASRISWAVVYPPPPEKVLIALVPYIIWVIGIAFIAIGLTVNYKDMISNEEQEELEHKESNINL